MAQKIPFAGVAALIYRIAPGDVERSGQKD
jgi:hypothetical protein